MSIVRMKHLRLAALKHDKSALFRALMKAGCVQIKEQDDKLDDPAWVELAHKPESPPSEWQGKLSSVTGALSALRQQAGMKAPIFFVRPNLREQDLYDDNKLSNALDTAGFIEQNLKKMSMLTGEIGRLQNRRAALQPWLPCDLPLQETGTHSCRIQFGVCPPNLPFEDLKARLEELDAPAAVEKIGADREQQYLLLIVYNAATDAVWDAFKPLGFVQVHWKEFEGTARSNVEGLEQQIAGLEKEREALGDEIASKRDDAALLEWAFDAISARYAAESAADGLLSLKSTFYLEGWIPETSLSEAGQIFERFDCAYSFTDPEEGADVPVLQKNGKLVAPLQMVTEMYSLPTYDGIDPNPLIMPFFTIFFGFMYADIGYGLVLLIASLLIQRKFHPKGAIGQMVRLAPICGVTTILAGILFGSFFGNSVSVIAELYFGAAPGSVSFPAIMDPMADPMALLILSLVIGAIHILTGMVIKAYMCFRDGHPLDALFDVGSWWLLFAGIAVLALGGTYWVAVAGAVALLLTQGRDKKKLSGKIVGGLASLYDITSYLSDILSYSRLMALMLASSVIGTVFNTLGAMTGVIGYIVVFFVGHAFNMGINIIGTYVHAARLQYLEFFSKFYESGGSAFQPLAIRTKYVDVLKEEK